MVEEQFKLGLTVELEQQSLPELRKLIEKEVQQAISVSAGKISKGIGGKPGAGRAAPGISTAALKSAADSVATSAGDVGKKLVQLAGSIKQLESSTDKTSKSFAASAQKIDDAVRKLVSVLDRRGAVAGGSGRGGPPAGGGSGGTGGGDGSSGVKKLNEARRKAARELNRSAAAEKAISDNLIKFDVNLDQDIRELQELEESLSKTNKAIRSFQSKIKRAEKEVKLRKEEGRGTKTVGKKLEGDRGRLAALKEDEKALRSGSSTLRKQVNAVEKLVSAAETHTKALQASQENVSAVSTSSKATAAQLESATATLKKTTSDLSGISKAADTLAQEINTDSGALTELSKRVRNASEQMTQRGKVLKEDNKQSARLRRERTKAAVAEAKSATSVQENIKATKEDTKQKVRLAKANRKAADRIGQTSEGKVGTGIVPEGAPKRAKDKAKAREKTSRDTQLAAKGTGKAIAQVKQAASEEARQPQQLREAKGPGGKKATGAPTIDKKGKDTSAAERYLKGAEVGANRLNKIISVFETKVKSIFPNRPKIMEEIGFKNIKAKMTEGASVGMRDRSGQVKLMKGTVDVFDGKVKRVGDVLGDLISDLSGPSSSRMKRVESTSRFREDAAADMLKGMLATSMGKMDVIKRGTVAGPLAQGGKVVGNLRLTKEQSEEATKFKGDDRKLILFANKLLGQISGGKEKLTEAGYDKRLTSVGLSEGAAPQVETVMKGKKVSNIILPLQARELSQFVPGGAPGIKEQRIPPGFAAGEMIGGEPPAWSTPGMKGLIAKGLVSSKQGKELRAAAVSMPEGMEDQIPISRKAAESIGVKSFESVTVTELGSSIKEGVKILEDKIIGKMGEEKVEFQLGPAFQAKVSEVRKIMVDGITRYKVLLEKSTLEGVGGKALTMGTLKGKTVVHESLGKTEQGEEIDIMFDPKSQAARGAVQDPTYMMASALSEATGGKTSVQEAGDALAEEMRIVGGKAKASLTEAVKKISEGLGLKGFTGTKKIHGGLIGKGAGPGGVEAVSGKIHVRFAQDQLKSEAKVKERFWSATDLASMEMAGLTETVALFRKSMADAQPANEDLIQSVIVLTSDFEKQSALLSKEGISPVMPSKLAALPFGGKAKESEAFKGTLADPEGEYSQAGAMLLPRRGGLHAALRMGEVGKNLGSRGTFQTKNDEVSANKLSRSLDKIREVSTAIMVRRGEVDIAESSETVAEGASMGDEAINAFAKRLETRLQSDPGDEEAIQEFDDLVAAMAPFIDSIQDAGKYIKYWSGGKAIPRKGERGTTLTGGQYVASRATGPDVATQKRNQVLAMRDLLFRRTTGGAKDKNVKGLGKLFEPENVEELRKALQLLDVQFDETGKRTSELYAELYGSKKRDPETGRVSQGKKGKIDEYYTALAQQVHARNKPQDPMKRSLMQQLGGGRSLGMRGRAFSIPTEIAPQLEAARKALNRLGQTGINVSKSLGAVDEMQKLQGDDVLPKDAIVVNRADFENWIQELVKFEGGDADALRKQFTEDGVLLHRDPTTGGASMQKRRLMLDDGDRVERGAIAVAGTFREGPGQVDKILGPMLKELHRLRGILKEKGGQKSPEIETNRKNFTALSAVVSDLINQFTSLGMNLDFDGDELGVHRNITSKASEALHRLASGGEAVWASFNEMIGASPGTVKGSTLESLDAAFKAKTPEGLAFKPQTEEQQQSNVSGLISGKLLVGMSTEVHHRFLMAIMAGLEEQDWSGAFRTVLAKLMLNINESLKMKHAGVGGMDEFEPKNMIDLIRRGDTKGLSAAIGKGGEYESLGQFNKGLLEKQEGQLLALDPYAAGAGGLTEGLKSRGLEEAIPKEGISAENYQGVIKAALKKMDIKNVFKEMHQTLINGYARSLEESGMSQKDIKAKIKQKLKKGKEGKPAAGIPLDEVVGSSFKPWLATRKTFTDKMKRTKGMGQLKEVASLLPKELMANVAEVMDIDIIDVDRESIMPKGIEQFATSLRESLMSVRNRLGDQLEVAKLPGGVGARYVEGTEGEAGGKGKIQTTSKVMGQLTQGLEVLSQIEAGSFTGTAQEAMQSLEGIRKFLGYLAHERVHQLGAGAGGKQIREVAGSLKSKAGGAALGKHRESIIASMSETVPGVRKLAKRVSDYRAKEEEDPTKGRRAKIGGKDVTGTAGEIAGQLEDQLLTLVAEELLAYLAQGRLEEILGGADLGEKALGFLTKRLKKMASGDKEVLGAAKTAGERLTSSALEGLMAGVEGQAVERGGIKGRVGSRALGQGVLGEDTLSKAQTRLALYEDVVLDAAKEQSFQLPLLDEEALGAGKLAFEKREIKGTTALPTEQTGRLNELMQQAREGIISGSDEKEIKAIANSMKRDTQDPDSRKRYQMVIREFQAAKAAMLINAARDLEAQMDALHKAGKGGGSEASLLKPKLEKAVSNVHEYLSSTVQQSVTKMPNLAYRGKGKGLTPAAQAAGLVPLSSAKEIPLDAVRGEGDEAKRFERTEQVLLGIHGRIEKNIDASKQLAVIWEHIKESPKLAHARLAKMATVTKEWAQYFRQANLPEASEHMSNLAKWTRQMANEMSQMTEPSLEGMLSRLPKGLTQTVGGGAAGGGLIMPMTDQYEAFEVRAKAHQKRLQGLIDSPQFKKMGLKTDFEPMKAQMIDPKTKQVTQNLEAQFKKVGKTIEYSFNQGGVAANRFGRRMKDSFRRVVQWGFATGIVYGTMRAFRSLSTVITDVQDRIFALKKVMDTTVTDFVAMQDAAVGMAKNYGIAINEVLDGMVVYGQQGLKMNDILARTNATLIAVNVTTLDAAGATEALTAAHKVFGDEVSGSIGFVDAWAKVAAKHAITAKDLADAVKRAGAAAGTAGMNFEDFMGVTTAIGVVTRQTGKEIGTSLKFMMRGMRRPVAQKEFGALGVKSLTDTGDLRPAMDILKDLAGAWDDMNKSQQLAIAQAAAGIRHYNSFIILMENFDEALSASADAAASQGFALRKNQIAMQTLGKQIGVLRESLKGLGLEVGKAILPTATAGIKVLSLLASVAGKIPGPLITIGTMGAAGMLAFHKAADMVVDSLDAMLGYGNEGPRLKKFFGKEGYMGGIAKGVGKAGKGLFGGMSGYTEFVTGATAAKMGGPSMAGTPFDPKEQGLIVRGFERMRLGIVGMSKAFMLLNTTMRVTTVLLGAGLVYAGFKLVQIWNEARKSGQDVADAMYDQIGQSQDLAESYRSQGTHLERVGLAHKKLIQAQKLEADVPATQKALAAGDFKGAALAAKRYHDIIAEVGKAIAKIDPTAIKTISESGEFIYEVSDGFAALTDNAVDAQNAITGALQLRVIKAFASDINEAKGFLSKLNEEISHLLNIEADSSLAGQLKESQKRIQSLAEYRDRVVQAGWDSVAVEEIYSAQLEHHLGLQEDITLSAVKLRQTLEQMPTFKNLETLAKLMDPEFFKAMQAVAPTGEFGRGATPGSIAFKQMAKSSGTGGLLDYTTGASPARLIETMIEKGIKPQAFQGAVGRASFPTNTGEVMAISKSIAEALLKETTSGYDFFSDEEKKEAVQAAQSLIGEVNSATGEMVWRFYNALTTTSDKASAIAVADIIGTVEASEAQILIFRKKAIEDAAAQTERLLTMQFIGAMAGIRDPGAFSIGPATRRDLTSEQRVMESLPNTLQRLVDIQKEMQEIQRKYNELIGDGNVEEAAAQMSKSAANIKVLDQRMQELAMTLQSEGFELSKVLHFNKAIQDLSKTLEEARYAAEDMSEAEKIRTKYVIETSGALAGSPTLPNVTFGKGAKELVGLERLVKRMPDMAKMVKGLDDVLQSRSRQVATFEEASKQYKTLKRSMKDLQTAEENMTAEQVKIRAKQLTKGMNAGDIGIMNAIKSQSKEQSSILDTQTNIQAAILDILKVQADPNLTDEQRQGGIRKAVTDAEMATLNKVIKELPPAVRRMAEEVATGIQYVPENRRGKTNIVYKIDEERGKKLGLEGKELKEFEKLQKLLLYNKGELQQATKRQVSGSGASDSGSMNQFRKNERIITEKLLRIGKIREEYRHEVERQLSSYLIASKQSKLEAEIDKSKTRQKSAQLEAAIQTLAAGKAFQDQIGGLAGELDKTNNTLLKIMQHGKMSKMAEDFAKTLEDMIDDFKKAEALELDPKKTKSDLQGPWARVGKPGFKDDFELRREEAEKKLSGRDMSERKAAKEELVKIEFDEEEAKIKKKQDYEVQKLKQQQSQAEKFRDTLYEAMDTGEYPMELQSQMRRIFDTLGRELETAEEATLRGEDLRFKGVPSLQNIKPFISQLKAHSEDQGRKAQFQMMRKAFEEGGGKQAASELAAIGIWTHDQLTEEKKHSIYLEQILAALTGRTLDADEMEAARVVTGALVNARKEEQKEAAKQHPKSALTATVGAAAIPALAALRTAADDAVTSIYKFSDEMYGVVTEIGGPGGRAIGTQAFEIKNGVIKMGDNAIVDEGFRGQGIGRKQIEEVSRFAKQQGIRKIEASRSTLDTRQVGAYKKAAEHLGAQVKLMDPGNLEMTSTIGGGGGVSYARKEGSDPILEMLVDKIEEGGRITARKGSSELLAQVESRFATQQGFIDVPKMMGVIDQLEDEMWGPGLRQPPAQQHLPGELTDQAKAAYAGLEPEEQALFERAKAANAEDLARAGAGGEIQALTGEIKALTGEIKAATTGGGAGAGGAPADLLGEILEDPFDMRGINIKDSAPDLADLMAERAKKAAKLNAERAAGPKGTGPEIFEGPRGAQFEDLELATFEAEHGVGEGGRVKRPQDTPAVKAAKRIKRGKLLARAGKILAPLASAVEGSASGYAGYKAGYAQTPEEQQRAGKEFGGGMGGIIGGIAGGGAAGLAAGAMTMNPIAAAVTTIVGGVTGGIAGYFGGSSLTGVVDKYTGGAFSSQLGDIFGARGADAITPLLMGIGDWLGDKVLKADPETLLGKAGGVAGRFLAKPNLEKPLSWMTGLGPEGAEGLPAAAAGMAPAVASTTPTPKSHEDLLRRIAEIQTLAPSGGFNDFGITGESLEAAKRQGRMYLPPSFGPGGKTGPGVPKVTPGTARTRYTGESSYSPQMQFFSPYNQDVSGPRRAFEGVESSIDEAGAHKNILRALGRGDRVFSPSGGGGPASAQKYIENLKSARARAQGHYGGASNQGIVRDANAQQALGVPVIAADPTINATGGVVQRGTSEIVARESLAGTATTGRGANESSQAIAQALEAVSQSLAALSQNGVTLPPDFTQTITAANEEVVRKLDDVTITSLPSDIIVGISESSITSLATSIGTVTAGAAVGAQQIAESIGELKSELLEEEGLVDQRITSSVGDVTGRLTQVENETLDLNERVVINTDDIVIINTSTVPGLTQGILQLNEGETELLLRVENNAIDITALDREMISVTALAEGTSEIVEDFQTSINDVVTASLQVGTRIEQFEEDFFIIQATVDTANANAENALGQADILRDSLTKFRGELDAKDTQLADNIRIDSQFAGKISVKVEDLINSTVPELRSKIENINNVARAARNAAQASKTV